MIDINKINVGDKVCYQPEHYKETGNFENGMVKEIPKGMVQKIDSVYGCVRVVYNCNDEWHRFKDFTSALTNLRDLSLGWK